MIINPNEIYFVAEVQKAMRWKPSTARREIREGRLRVCRRAGRYYIRGQWLLDWIEAGADEREAAKACEAGMTK